MPIDAGNCPHCGSRVITKLQSIVIMVIGLVLMTTALVGLWPVVGVGLLLLLGGGAFYWNRQQKIQNASR